MGSPDPVNRVHSEHLKKNVQHQLHSIHRKNNFRTSNYLLASESFVFKVMSSTLLLGFFILGLTLVAHFISRTHHSESEWSRSEHMCRKLESIFSMPRLFDLKFVGLLVFLSSNVMIGPFRMLAWSIKTTHVNSFLISNLHAFFSLLLPFIYAYLKK